VLAQLACGLMTLLTAAPDTLQKAPISESSTSAASRFGISVSERSPRTSMDRAVLIEAG